ncbi:MAG TPA: hypothetical protein DCF63_10245, partial [Planctomycetaceae bacterium]|nr:hypothetical protein [Planctomycetaceae bacterium]
SLRQIALGGKPRDAAVRTLYQRIAKPMLRFFVYMGASTAAAKDILQEPFVKLVLRANGFDGDGSATAWIWQVARNCLMDHHRRNGRLAEHEVAMDVDGWKLIEEAAPAPPDDSASHSIDECVTKGLAAFSAQMPERAFALTLQMEGLGIAEIGERLGRTATAAKEYLSQCRKKLHPFVVQCAELLAE